MTIPTTSGAGWYVVAVGEVAGPFVERADAVYQANEVNGRAGIDADGEGYCNALVVWCSAAEARSFAGL